MYVTWLIISCGRHFVWGIPTLRLNACWRDSIQCLPFLGPKRWGRKLFTATGSANTSWLSRRGTKRKAINFSDRPATLSSRNLCEERNWSVPQTVSTFIFYIYHFSPPALKNKQTNRSNPLNIRTSSIISSTVLYPQMQKYSFAEIWTY